MAVDPRSPSAIVAGSNTNYSAPVGDTLPVAYFTSHDGGRTFSVGAVPVARPYTTGADPTVAISATHTVFYSYLGETPSYCSGGRSAVVLTHSTDLGRSFHMPVIVDTNNADDKPNMAVENGPHHTAHIFLTWTRWFQSRSEIWYARSLDGGASFSRPIRLYGSALDNFGSVPVVGPHGRVYVFWSSSEIRQSGTTRTRILMVPSTDDGAHFGEASATVPMFWSMPEMAIPGSLRNLTMPSIVVDGGGTLAMAWTAAKRQHKDGSVEADIEVSRSTNGGRSWAVAVAVNDSHTRDRFMPALALMTDGSLGVAFYDRRNGWWRMDTYAARLSFSGGTRVSPNVRVNAAVAPVSDIFYLRPGSTCFVPGRFFGDYIGVSPVGADTLSVVWADTQLHVPQETEVWFAPVVLPPVRSRRVDAARNRLQASGPSGAATGRIGTHRP